MFGKKGGDGYEAGPGWAGMPAEASEKVVLAPGHKVLNPGNTTRTWGQPYGEA